MRKMISTVALATATWPLFGLQSSTISRTRAEPGQSEQGWTSVAPIAA